MSIKPLDIAEDVRVARGLDELAMKYAKTVDSTAPGALGVYTAFIVFVAMCRTYGFDEVNEFSELWACMKQSDTPPSGGPGHA